MVCQHSTHSPKMLNLSMIGMPQLFHIICVHHCSIPFCFCATVVFVEIIIIFSIRFDYERLSSIFIMVFGTAIPMNNVDHHIRIQREWIAFDGRVSAIDFRAGINSGIQLRRWVWVRGAYSLSFFFLTIYIIDTNISRQLQPRSIPMYFDSELACRHYENISILLQGN